MPALAEPAPHPPASGARWSDLRKRLISAVILAPLVLLCLWVGGLPYTILMLGAAIGLAWEWVSLCGTAPLGRLGAPVIGAVTAAALAAALGHAEVGLILLVAGTIVTSLLVRGAPHKRALALGVPYVGVGVVALLWLRADPQAGLVNLLFPLLLVWGSDIGAYLAGRVLGGPKLAPRISPGKTWSGAIGGLIGAVAMGWLVVSWSGQPAAFARVAAIAVGLGIFAQAGDLLESLIKRRFGVKDSGTLIPGHGGLLDRLDALLIAAPVAALLAFAAGRGVVLWQ